MRFDSVDPNELKIDQTNERISGVGPHSDDGNLEDSISELGIIQAVTAREVDGEYKVIAGQRRTLAAQATGIDEIPVLIKDVDEGTARAISIAENDESFDRDVDRDDRAKSTKDLVDALGSQSAAAEKLGVNDAVISRRLERTRDYWEGTEVHWENNSEVEIDALPDDLIAGVRNTVDDPQESEGLVKKIIREKIPRRVVEPALEKAQTAEDLENNLDSLFHDEDVDETEVELELSLSGSVADALVDYSKSRGTSPKKAIRRLVTERLAEQDYFDEREEQETTFEDFF